MTNARLPSYAEVAHRDRLGRGTLHRFQGIVFLRAYPWLLTLFTGQVPDEMLAEEVADDGRRAYVVPCPCGAEPLVPLADIIECPGACGRFFLHAGSRVRVAKFGADGDRTAAENP